MDQNISLSICFLTQTSFFNQLSQNFFQISNCRFYRFRHHLKGTAFLLCNLLVVFIFKIIFEKPPLSEILFQISRTPRFLIARYVCLPCSYATDPAAQRNQILHIIFYNSANFISTFHKFYIIMVVFFRDSIRVVSIFPPFRSVFLHIILRLV